MNKISVQTAGPETILGIDETYRLIKEWGFDAADANIDHVLGYGAICENRIPEVLIKGGKECMDLFRPWGEMAKKYGIENYQAHAPFPSFIRSIGKPEHDKAVNESMLAVLENTIRGCEIINCHNLIIHPFFAGYDTQLSPEDEWNLNIESYSKLIPAAKNAGVTICLENMFMGRKGKIYAACCSDITKACEYVDTLNAISGEKTFGFCLDTGHALLCGLDIKQTMIELGDRICAFHIHDNDGKDDLHIAPYMGVLDWNRFVEGLKAINYDKTLSFETFNVWNKIDTEVVPDIMRFIARCGRMFAKRAAM